MSSKDKKARRVALRDFLIAIPGVLDRATASLGWLVVLGAVALGALLLHLLFAPGGPAPVPPPGGQGDNPTGALYVRDLGRLPDGRHTFDLVYELVLRNETERPFSLDSYEERLAIGDPALAGDIVALSAAPKAFKEPVAGGRWHVALSRHHDDYSGKQPEDYPPGRWGRYSAHYHINARPEQSADVAIGYGLRQESSDWFGHRLHFHSDAHGEEVQLGAVLRAHCPLGVKVQNGEVKSLCGS